MKGLCSREKLWPHVNGPPGAKIYAFPALRGGSVTRKVGGCCSQEQKSVASVHILRGE